MAFNAKNLHYEKKVPAFLQRLQGQYTGDERNSAAQQRLQQRPKKLKSSEDDNDDAPTYVDEESGELVGKEEYERLVRGDDREEEKVDWGIGEDIGKLPDGDKTSREKGEKSGKSAKVDWDELAEQKIAEIGAGRKRKVGKVVGGDDAGDGKVDGKVDGKTRAPTSGNFAKGRNGTESKEKAADPKKTSAKAKGGKKKIKLSFDED